MIAVLEEVFRTMIRKKFGADENFNVIINAESGDLEMWRSREIVDDNSEDIWDFDKIPLSEAKLIEPDFEIGEEVAELVKLEDFGRRAVLAVRQNLVQKILELEKNDVFNKYKERVGEIVNAEVYQIWKKEIMLLDDDGNELILPKTEQIPSDFFKKGEMVRAVLKKVELRSNTPFIIVSRTSPMFLEKLLELEVPEILDGLITIKKVVREPGERAKVAVESFDDRIDPVGACVGMKGSRIHSIVRELKNENIDIINFTTNTSLLIQRSLTPSKINRIDLDNENKQAQVFLESDQVSLAIGRKGVNIKLAQELTGYTIDVYRDVVEQDAEYDIDLEEFSDEIEQWIIDSFKRVGCDTANSVLKLSDAELERRTDLEKETIADVRRILKAEFDQEQEA